MTAMAAMGSPISKQQALEVAQRFLGPHTSVTGLRQAPTRITGTDNSDLLYVFNSSRRGWVIVAGDDQAIPVLGYSDHGSLDLSKAPANMLAWIELSKQYVEACSSSSAATHAARIGTPVQPPLLGDICWGQGAPFNLLCPTYQNDGQTTNYYVGCVATAATQIMKLHNYPPKGTGSKTYTSNGLTLTADFGSTTYDWDLILPEYTSATTAQQQNAVATLAAHFGIAVEMEYAPSGSGALSQLVPAALRDYFGYDSAVTMHKRDYYSTSEWMQLIKSEIDAGRAVFYGASSDVSNSGHAFVCDGYDTEDYVHINWGWNGTSNGYFLVSHLDPSTLGIGGGTGGYNLDQEIVTGIQPPTGLGTQALRPLYNPMSMRLYTQTSSDFGIITSVENHDTRPFTGDLAVVAVRNDTIIAVLKTFSAQIDGFAGGHSGLLAMKTIDGISKNVGNVPDGPCTIRMAFREDASAQWNIMRYCRGRDSRGLPYIGQFSATVAGGTLGEIDGSCQVPDVSLLTPLAPDGDVYAQGSAHFNVTLRNNSGDVRLKNIVIRFTSAEDPNVFFDYENAVNCYDEVTEDLSLLVNLDDNMPQGQYLLSAYEKGFPDYPFTQAQPSKPITVLPPATLPVMRLTQHVLWQMPGDNTIINQGDNVYFALNTRNYGAPGTVGVILYLVDTANPTKRYMYQQANASVAKGEAKTLTFYRKLPLDPGTYRVQIAYATEDGHITDDNLSPALNDMVTVQPAPAIAYRITEAKFPRRVKKGEQIQGSVTITAEESFSGTVYVRMRQYTLTNGGILNMGSVKLNPGESKTINVKQTINFDAGRYTLMYEAKAGSAELVVGSYNDAYRLIDVVDDSFTLGDINADGVVDVQDVNMTINTILGRDTRIDMQVACDVNGDGAVDVADVNAIINIILKR